MCLSKTKSAPPADIITTPQTGYSFTSPYIEDYSRRILASYFGSPGEYEGLISRPRDIPIEQTAGLTPLQIQARQASQGLGQFAPYIDQARGMIEEGAGTVSGGIGALQRAEQSGIGATQMFDPRSASMFYDPYEDQVVQQTLQDINRAAAQQDIGLRDRAISQGAFGGSRGRIAQEELARATGRGAAEAVGALRSQGFGRAQDAARQSFEAQQGRQAGLANLQSGLAGQQAALGGQQAALGQGIAGLGQQGQGMLGSQINMLNQLGAQGQATQQAALSRQFGAAQQLAQEPLQRLQQGQALLAGSPMGGISGGTGTSAYQRGVYQQPTGLGQAIGAAGTIMTGLGALGYSPFGSSDAELKENITKIGELEPGIGWYTWDWNDKAKDIGAETEPSEGLLAQEVLKVKPEAVVVKDGYYAVDYSKVM
jgi:hypothetical protein|tara:strand:- start:27 stop:1304 length:1278 start_codon:yes stop_codon:yes gene_type:complete